MSEDVQFIYREGLFQDFIIAYQNITKKHVFKISIPITDFINSDDGIDDIDIWYEKIYEKCKSRNIPDEYMELDDYYKNPENPKMTKNINKYEFCLEKQNTDDYSCCFDECPRRSEGK